MLTLDTKIEITNKNNTKNKQNIPIFCARIAKNNLTQAATSWHKSLLRLTLHAIRHVRTASRTTHASRKTRIGCPTIAPHTKTSNVSRQSRNAQEGANLRVYERARYHMGPERGGWRGCGKHFPERSIAWGAVQLDRVSQSRVDVDQLVRNVRHMLQIINI